MTPQVFATMPHGCALVRQLLLFAALAMAMPASAALHERFRGGDVLVHYVHLTGQDGDNDAHRRTLIEQHRACTQTQQLLGKPAHTLAMNDIPAVPRPEEVDIYYGAGRTLTLTTGKRYRIDRSTCALDVALHRTVRITSVAGTCDMDIDKNTMRGQCDVHNSMPAGAKPAHSTIVPAPATPGTRFRQVSGIGCEVVTHAAVQTEKCIANPPSTFSIPASPYHAERRGLLLALASKAMTLTADRVKMHLTVAEAMFSPAAVMQMMLTEGAGQ